MERLDRDKEVESVMIVATPPSRGIRSRKRRREKEELSSPSAEDTVFEKNLKETAPMILARWKTAAYKGSSVPRKLAEVIKGMEVSTSSQRRKTTDLRRQTPKGVRRVDKHGKWTLAKNGSRLSTRLLGNE